jgi:ABC-type multidrug transport system permease subunit
MAQQIDIQNFKCVPLDILKNISKDNKLQVNITPDDVTLRSLKDAQQAAVVASGPINPRSNFSADDIENFLVYLVIAFASLFILIILFYGGLNLRTHGFAAFTLPENLRAMPVVALCSIIFGVLGFIVGRFT